MTFTKLLSKLTLIFWAILNKTLAGNFGAPMGHQTAALGQQMGQIPQATGPPPSTITGVNPFSKLGRKKPAAKTANHEFKCEYCQVFLNSQKQLEQHNSSPKHITTKNSINKQMGQNSRNRGDEKFIMHKMRWKISRSPKKVQLMPSPHCRLNLAHRLREFTLWLRPNRVLTSLKGTVLCLLSAF